MGKHTVSRNAYKGGFRQKFRDIAAVLRRQEDWMAQELKGIAHD